MSLFHVRFRRIFVLGVDFQKKILFSFGSAGFSLWCMFLTVVASFVEEDRL